MKSFMHTFVVSAALLLSTMQSQALEMPELEECVTIPHAVFNAPLTTTVVGLYVDSTAEPNGTVFWSFFDAGGAQRANGNFAVAAGTINGFVLSAALSPALQNVDGFLLFCLDNKGDNRIDSFDHDHMAAGAFFIDAANSDVAFVPVIETSYSDISHFEPVQWQSNMPIQSMGHNNEIENNNTVAIQYAINGIVNNGDDTRIYIFSTSNTLGANQSMTIHTSTGLSTAVNVPTPSPYLNIIDPETLTGFDTATYLSGFFNWVVPGTFKGDAYAFSVIKAPGFGATQTLVGIIND